MGGFSQARNPPAPVPCTRVCLLREDRASFSDMCVGRVSPLGIQQGSTEDPRTSAKLGYICMFGGV